jgi:FkbM family methyltransferase
MIDRESFEAVLVEADTARQALASKLSDLARSREVLIYSYGARGADLAEQLRAAGVTPVVFDNAPTAVERAQRHGFRTTDTIDHDLPLIVAAGQNQIEILDGLTRPVFGLAEALHAFDLRNSYGRARDFSDAIVADAGRAYEVYARLDEASRPAFLDLLTFRASLDIRRMVHRRPVADMWTPPVDGLDIRSFCDLGAYDGDSLTAVKALFPRVERSFTVEPNATQAPVIARLASRLGVRNTNFVGAAWDRRARLGGRTLANGMMVLDEDAGGDIEGERLDALLGDEAFDYIKLDVEGSEAAALSGAVAALGRARCVAVAGYHLPDDLYDLPRHVFGLLADQAPSWRLAFGHNSQSFEDSFFYFYRPGSGTE